MPVEEPTFSQVYSAYIVNASYEEDASISMAKVFITACRRLVAMRAQRSRLDGVSETEFDVALIKKEQQDARAWVAENDID
ncbi:MAG: hypothetical protein JKX85_11115, partial [Phycisphaeraceae bacterium]|nr:hypothetical protein [Phycisphaeraceae bacterium]